MFSATDVMTEKEDNLVVNVWCESTTDEVRPASTVTTHGALHE